jgi:hypothetical protein
MSSVLNWVSFERLIIRIPFLAEWRKKILFITEWGTEKAKKFLSLGIIEMQARESASGQRA